MIMSKLVTLIRTIRCDDGVFGHLVEGDFHLVTAEPEMPREGNKGCIPPGSYRCVWEPYGKHKGYSVKGVPGFENIEIHGGNVESDTAGCVLLGTKRGKLSGKEAILNSQTALTAFNDRFDHGEFQLLIIERFQEIA